LIFVWSFFLNLINKQINSLLLGIILGIAIGLIELGVIIFLRRTGSRGLRISRKTMKEETREITGSKEAQEPARETVRLDTEQPSISISENTSSQEKKEKTLEPTVEAKEAAKKEEVENIPKRVSLEDVPESIKAHVKKVKVRSQPTITREKTLQESIDKASENLVQKEIKEKPSTSVGVLVQVLKEVNEAVKDLRQRLKRGLYEEE